MEQSLSGEGIDRSATIVNRRGLHARAASRFVQTASAFDAQVSVTRGGQTVSGSSIMGLMMLAAGPGTEIQIHAEGPQAAQAVDAICAIIAAKFGEEEG
ncbi:MAG: HPr family phosphocarrier protein [Hyphomicrobiales bacterium]|nr:HPr family phosphocarrier protein [Hyphomicrobiales bacterium]